MFQLMNIVLHDILVHFDIKMFRYECDSPNELSWREVKGKHGQLDLWHLNKTIFYLG